MDGRRFAAVLCHGVLGYLHDPEAMVDQLCRCAAVAGTVEQLSELVASFGVEPVAWYGAWLIVDWLEFSGIKLDPNDFKQVAATAAVEFEASRRDPYRQLSRVFHLLARKRSC